MEVIHLKDTQQLKMVLGSYRIENLKINIKKNKTKKSKREEGGCKITHTS